jgi:hypothetical protein
MSPECSFLGGMQRPARVCARVRGAAALVCLLVSGCAAEPQGVDAREGAAPASLVAEDESESVEVHARARTHRLKRLVLGPEAMHRLVVRRDETGKLQQACAGHQKLSAEPRQQ